MSRAFAFRQVDVFSAVPLLGNPLAVVHDAVGLTDAQMQTFARWTNLSETAFLLPPENPDADYRVRIFTPGMELPFAGHPTLGSCHAWLAAGGKAKSSEVIVQECGIGLVTVRRDGARLAFAAPPLRRSGPLDGALLDHIADGLGIARGDILDHQWVDNGPGFCAVVLGSGAAVRALKPDFAKLKDLKLGVIAPQTDGEDSAFEVRAFVTPSGINEDTATGSLNAGLAAWMTSAGISRAPYVVAQGAALGRDARLHVSEADGRLWIGGNVAACVEGRVTL